MSMISNVYIVIVQHQDLCLVLQILTAAMLTTWKPQWQLPLDTLVICYLVCSQAIPICKHLEQKH